MINQYKFINTPLPYSFDALEPFIDAKTMELHHDRHLQAYIDNLNTILSKQPRYQNWPLEQLLLNIASLPEEIQALKHFNISSKKQRFPSSVPVMPGLFSMPADIFGSSPQQTRTRLFPMASGQS